jgi:hypothetical protein
VEKHKRNEMEMGRRRTKKEEEKERKRSEEEKKRRNRKTSGNEIRDKMWGQKKQRCSAEVEGNDYETRVEATAAAEATDTGGAPSSHRKSDHQRLSTEGTPRLQSMAAVRGLNLRFGSGGHQVGDRPLFLLRLPLSFSGFPRFRVLAPSISCLFRPFLSLLLSRLSLHSSFLLHPLASVLFFLLSLSFFFFFFLLFVILCPFDLHFIPFLSFFLSFHLLSLLFFF